MSDRIEMLEATLDLMDGGVAILDDRSYVLFWNDAAATLTGYLAREVLSQPCPEGLYHVDEAHQGRAGAGSPECRQREPADTASQFSSLRAGHAERIALLEVPYEGEKADGDSLERPTLVAISHRLATRFRQCCVDVYCETHAVNPWARHWCFIRSRRQTRYPTAKVAKARTSSAARPIWKTD